jgi:hypothetical protein
MATYYVIVVSEIINSKEATFCHTIRVFLFTLIKDVVCKTAAPGKTALCCYSLTNDVISQGWNLRYVR